MHQRGKHPLATDVYLPKIVWTVDQAVTLPCFAESFADHSFADNPLFIVHVYFAERGFCLSPVGLLITGYILGYKKGVRRSIWFTRDGIQISTWTGVSLLWIFLSYVHALFLQSDSSYDLSPTLGFVSYSRMMDPGTRPGVPKNILIDVLPSQKSAVWIGHVSYLRPWLYHP